MITILGAGLAGLAAAYELIKSGISGKDIVIFEKEEEVGGLAQTKTCDGFSFDLGPHRWFTKSDEIHRIWEEVNSPDILEINRFTRIAYKQKLLEYPLCPLQVCSSLGVTASADAICSYLWQSMKNRFSSKPPQNMEDAFVKQFGPVLYNVFFRQYNQKLWGGGGCKELSPDWVKQRVKNLSLGKAFFEAIGFGKNGEIVSFVHRFMYPSLGTGQTSIKMMESLQLAGVRIYCSCEVEAVIHTGKRITQVVVNRNGLLEEYDSDYCISSIPIDRLTCRLIPGVATETRNAAASLAYRSIIFVVLFLDVPQVVRDNWIYIQDPAICFNRFMDMASWNKDLSPPGKTSLVFEVTCNAGDEAWNLPDDAWIPRVQNDFIRGFGLIDAKKVLGGTVVKKTHAYPVYAIDYKTNLSIIKEELKKLKNLELIGRNGMFRYNNMDHSISSGIAAARNFLGEKNDLNAIIPDGEYLEEKGGLVSLTSSSQDSSL